MKKISYLVILIMIVFQIKTVNATVLTFDDLTDIIPTNEQAPIDDIGIYGGLHWNNMLYTDPDEFNFHLDNIGNSGYENGLVSHDHVAFNSGGNQATIFGDVIDFEGCYLTGAWRDGLNINVQGFKAGALLYEETVVADSTSATWFEFNFLGIDTLVLSSFGGIAHGYTAGDSGGSIVLDGTMFVMDDFTFETTPVPEPASIIMVCLGLTGPFFLRSRKRRRAEK